MATSCDLNAPRCTTEVLRVRLHGSRGGVFIGHRPPRDPGDPPHIYNINNRSFTHADVSHTHMKVLKSLSHYSKSSFSHAVQPLAPFPKRHGANSSFPSSHFFFNASAKFSACSPQASSAVPTESTTCGV